MPVLQVFCDDAEVFSHPLVYLGNPASFLSTSLLFRLQQKLFLIDRQPMAGGRSVPSHRPNPYDPALLSSSAPT